MDVAEGCFFLAFEMQYIKREYYDTEGLILVRVPKERSRLFERR